MLLRIKEAIHSHITDLSTKGLSGLRRCFLHQKKFTIISNNCWAGWVYRRYGLEYQTPTIGLYMFAQDYINFCKKLDYYLMSELKFISPNESRYKDLLIERKQQNVPIGILGDGDVEIIFLHYSSEKEAYDKWNRRLKRVNKDCLYLKFSEMDLCTPELIEEFENLPYPNKVCFTAREYPHWNCCIPVSKIIQEDRVANDTTYYANYIDLTKFLNTGKLIRKGLAKT